MNLYPPGKFLSDPKYASISLFCGVVTLFAFTLEEYANSTPAPTVVTKEGDVPIASPMVRLYRCTVSLLFSQEFNLN